MPMSSEAISVDHEKARLGRDFGKRDLIDVN